MKENNIQLLLLLLFKEKWSNTDFRYQDSVNPLLSPQGGLFISSSFEGMGRGGGVLNGKKGNREGGYYRLAKRDVIQASCT